MKLYTMCPNKLYTMCPNKLYTMCPNKLYTMCPNKLYTMSPDYPVLHGPLYRTPDPTRRDTRSRVSAHFAKREMTSPQAAIS